MPLFFQQQVDECTRLGIWKIEEPEAFFRGNVPLHRDVTHPHKRLQHLAGRFLLQLLYPGFPYELVRIADTRKPYLPGEEYHFSISHCGDFAAAIVSKEKRVGIDIEIPVEKIGRIAAKFLSAGEMTHFSISLPPAPESSAGNRPAIHQESLSWLTTLWSCKEAVFKWYGLGGVDFRGDIRLAGQGEEVGTLACYFNLTGDDLVLHYRLFGGLVLAWVVT